MFQLVSRISILLLAASVTALTLADLAAPRLSTSEQVVFIARVSSQLQLMIADLKPEHESHTRRGRRRCLSAERIPAFA